MVRPKIMIQPLHDGAGFLAGGGEMGALIRAYDWGNSSLGPPAQWSQALKVTVRLLLSSGHPMFIWWGPQLIQCTGTLRQYDSYFVGCI